MDFVCPLPAALTSVPVQNCPFKFDQIVRILFQRRQPSNAPTFNTLTAIQTLATWEGLEAAVGNTKVIYSPIFAGLTIPPSEALTTGGGDNSTFAGIREYNGEGAVTVNGVFKNMAPVVKRALNTLPQESLAGSTGISNLTAYLVNRDGIIFCVNPAPNEEATTNYFGIPIYNFRVSSTGSEGFNAPNINNFSFDMQDNWDKYLVAIKPAFDPLADLA